MSENNDRSDEFRQEVRSKVVEPCTSLRDKVGPVSEDVARLLTKATSVLEGSADKRLVDALAKLTDAQRILGSACGGVDAAIRNLS